MPDWLIRILITLGICGFLILAYILVRAWNVRVIRKRSRQLISAYDTGKTIIYFTTSDCMACKAAQNPALNQLKYVLVDDIQIITIDAYEKPDVANAWGVMSVPTTFILDEHGDPKVINYGVTPFKKLYKQIQSLHEM